ncbi:MAG TPA: hypothetical protein VIG36_06405, partial [Methylocystis sp.]
RPVRTRRQEEVTPLLKEKIGGPDSGPLFCCRARNRINAGRRALGVSRIRQSTKRDPSLFETVPIRNQIHVAFRQHIITKQQTGSEPFQTSLSPN